jgi:hypothetical protein
MVMVSFATAGSSREKTLKPALLTVLPLAS